MKKQRISGYGLLALGAAIVVIVSGVLVIAMATTKVGHKMLNSGPLKDGGITLCEKFRDEMKATPTAGKKDPKPAESLSESEYHKLRDMFAGSRYDDIRDAGIKFADLIWQMQKMFDGASDDFGSALVMVGAFYSAYANLSGACGAHGVVLPPPPTN